MIVYAHWLWLFPLKGKALHSSWAPIRYDEEDYDPEDNFYVICEGIGVLQ